MVQFLANKTAQYLAKGDDPADIEVITYGYYMFYQQWLVIIAILLIALPLGWFFPVLASLVTSMALRGCVCGTHATHPLICKITSVVLAFTPAVLTEVFAIRLVPVAALAMYLVSIALVVRYAPGETDVRKFRDSRKRKRMKIESVVLVTVFFFAAVFLSSRFPGVAFVVTTTAFITCCFVHPWAYRLFGFDPVTKEALKPRW